jgi:hypothetical protein
MAIFLSPQQRALLDVILDRLIPASGNMPSAGQAGTADHIDGAAGGSARIAKLFTAGLRSIELAAARGGVAFIDMSSDQQAEILRGIEANKSAFFETLLLHTYNGYYSNPRVVEALGLEPRPPQPRGHEVAVGDFSSLEAVQSRGQAYRDA